MAETVSVITGAANSVIQNVVTLRNLFGESLNMSGDWEDGLLSIQYELNRVQDLLPGVYFLFSLLFIACLLMYLL